jgi:hypothetical protein
MYRLTYGQQELDTLPDDTPLTDLRADKCIHAAFMGVRPYEINVEHVDSTESFLKTRGAA